MVYIWRSVRLHPLPIKLNALCTGDPYLGMFKMRHCALSRISGNYCSPLKMKNHFDNSRSSFLLIISYSG